MGRSDSGTSVSACSAASSSASRGRPKASGGAHRNAVIAGGASGARHRAEQRRGQTAGLGPNLRIAAQNQTLYMNQAMWMQTAGPPQMPHPQWPQLWARPPFAGGSFPAQPSSSPEEKKGEGNERQLKRSDAEKGDKDLKKEKGKKDKKEKKDKTHKKEKKSKKEKKAAQNIELNNFMARAAADAAAAADADKQAPVMATHLEPSDSEPQERGSSALQVTGQGKPENKAKDETEDVEELNKKGPALAAGPAPAASGDLPVDADPTAGRLRQALGLLKERRQELEEMSADNDELIKELDDVEAELEKEREGNRTLAARSLEEQSKLSKLQSELDETKQLKLSLDSLQAELNEKSANLDQAQAERTSLTDSLAKAKSQFASSQAELGKSRENAGMTQTDLLTAQSQLAEQLKLNAQLRSSLEGAQSKLRVQSAELDLLQQKAKAGGVTMLQSKLKGARSDLESGRKELAIATTEIYNSRRKHQVLTDELAKARKLTVSEDARKGLNEAWEMLLSLLEQQLGPDELEVGFQQLGAALRTAGFWQPEADAEEAAATRIEPDGDGAPSSASQPEPPLARLQSDADLKKGRRLRNTDEKLDQAEKHARREKKEKKGKASKDKRHAEEDGDKEVTEPMPHRTCSIGPPSLKKRRIRSAQGATADSPRSARLTFADDENLASHVTVTTYKVLKEKLWFTNPLANVQCEKCERRVPQQQGRLQGNPGYSQFMQEKFHCSDCVEPNTVSRSEGN